VPTIAGYPARRIAVDLGGTCTQLYVVDRLEDFVDGDTLLRDADAPEPPYWAHLWPGARCLARLVATQVECGGRRVVEIGCGLGLAGLAAAMRGAHVTMIDTAHAALRFVHASAAMNNRRVATVQTDIRCAGIRGLFDYFLAADVTYDPQLQDALADFLAAHLTPEGHAWLTESVRTFDQGLRRACERHGLQVDERETREPDAGREVVVRITEVHRPPSAHSDY
jgi:predicted nicotinamide N-methyase